MSSAIDTVAISETGAETMPGPKSTEILDVPTARQLAAELGITDQNMIISLAAAEAGDLSGSSSDNAADSSEPGNSRKNRIMQSIKEFASIGTLLRLAGTVSMVAALVFFLFDGFHSATEHISRFWILLGFSSITAIGGIAMSRLFKDQKGARSLVAVALISVPACFAVLGALVYSIFPLDGLSSSYPQYLLWQAADVTQLGIASLVCTVVAGAVGFLGFSVMAPQVRVQLFVSMMLGSLLLVVPVRESLIAAVVAAIAVLVCLSILFVYVRPVVTLKTGWSVFAMALTALPAAIAIGRSVWLYDLRDLVVLALAASAHVGLVLIARFCQGKMRALAETGLMLTMLATIFAFAVFVSTLPSGLFSAGQGYSVAWTVLLLSALYLHLDWFMENRGVAMACRLVFSLMWFSLMLLGTLVFNDGLLLVVVSFMQALALTGYAVSKGYKSIGLTGFAVTLLLLVRHHDELLSLAYGAGILGAVGFGIVCVVAAHLLEKYGPVMKLRFSSKNAVVSN